MMIMYQLRKMKSIRLIISFFFAFTCSIHLNAQWTKIYGGNGEDNAYLILQTADGGYIVAGDTHSFESLTTYLWILKIDLNGAVEWQNLYSSGYYKNLLTIQQASDGGYIVGSNGSSFYKKNEIWFSKLGSSGNIDEIGSYARVIDSDANFIQQTSDGGFILTGTIFLSEEKKNDIWVAKLTSTGNIEWQRTYGGSENDNARSLQQTSDGGYIVAGDTNSFGAQGSSIWILKLFSTGTLDWQRKYGRIGQESARSIQQTDDGGYILGGLAYSSGSEEDVWVLKLNASGNIEWQRTYGGSNKDYIYDIHQTGDGGYIVGANTLSFGAGGKDFWMLKLTILGNIEWQKTFGTSLDEEAYSIQQTNDGGYIVAGGISSFSSGLNDFLILKLLPDGNTGLGCRFIEDSDARVSDTDISPEDTQIIPVDTNVIHELTFPGFTPKVTDATAYQLCSEKPLLSIHTSTGGTTDPAPGNKIYDLGAMVSVKALPESKSRFVEWSGDASDIDNPITITMDSDKFVIANFVLQYVLTITSGKGGTTDPPPGTYKDDFGKELSIKAIAETGYEFSQWSGDVSGADNPTAIAFNSDKSIKANFVVIKKEYKENFLDNIFRISTCSIATAAYGSPLHPYVRVLRDFRDRYLIKGKIGRSLIRLYYKHSPSLAEKIAKHKALRFVARVSLIPLVAFSYSMVRFGLIMTASMTVFIFISPIFLISFWRKKRKKLLKLNQIHKSVLKNLDN